MVQEAGEAAAREPEAVVVDAPQDQSEQQAATLSEPAEDDEDDSESDSEEQPEGKSSGYDKYLANQAKRAEKEAAKRIPNPPKNSKAATKGKKKKK